MCRAATAATLGRSQLPSSRHVRETELPLWGTQLSQWETGQEWSDTDSSAASAADVTGNDAQGAGRPQLDKTLQEPLALVLAADVRRNSCRRRLPVAAHRALSTGPDATGPCRRCSLCGGPVGAGGAFRRRRRGGERCDRAPLAP